MPTEIISSLDDFLSHRTGGGGGGSYMKSWKKRQPAQIDVWLHTKRPPIAIPQHNFPFIFTRTDRQSGQSKRNVYSRGYNCPEAEATVKDQYKYNTDRTRRSPATKCALCRLIDTIRRGVEDGTYGFTEPAFKFEGDDDIKVIHTGGIYNAYGDRSLSDEEKKWMREANIRMNEAWMENANAKINYMFPVVDNDDIGAGIQVTTETSLLGDKTKDAIIAQRKSRGDKGDPFKNPYCIRWENDKSQKEFQKKYSATAMTEIPYAAKIRDLITGDAPDLSGMTKPFNSLELRAMLEQYAVIKLPWDEIFDVEASEDESPPEQQAQGETDEEVCPECGPNKVCKHVACAKCDKPILESDPVCKHCGYVYKSVPAKASTTGRRA